MKADVVTLGRVVVSTQGRDKGQWFVVYQLLDEQHVLVCNGDSRKLEHPKKKRIKHLTGLPFMVQVTGKGGSGGAISNSDLRKALQQQRDAYEAQTAFSLEKRVQHEEENALVQK